MCPPASGQNCQCSESKLDSFITGKNLKSPLEIKGNEPEVNDLHHYFNIWNNECFV
jgi:hypothetical protein